MLKLDYVSCILTIAHVNVGYLQSLVDIVSAQPGDGDSGQPDS
jgi:hypothetical protein